MSKNDDDLRPSWVPEEPNPEFACSVVRGIDSAVNSVTGAKEYPDAVHLRKVPLRKKMSIEEYVEGVAKGDRMILSKAITLIESNAPKDFDKAQRVLQALLPRTGHALRIGITGVPGAGKSSFIESFGTMLCQQGYKVAAGSRPDKHHYRRIHLRGQDTYAESLQRTELFHTSFSF